MVLAASILVSVVQRRGENESGRPNRMETRFFEIAYRKFPEELPFPRDIGPS